jgi:ABC-type transporter Mla MlaB component
MSFGRGRGPKVMAPPALSIHGPLLRDDLPGLYARLCAEMSALPAGDVRCAVADIAADAVAVEALARFQLAARRQARRVVLTGASADLRGLVELMGLSDVLVAA